MHPLHKPQAGQNEAQSDGRAQNNGRWTDEWINEGMGAGDVQESSPPLSRMEAQALMKKLDSISLEVFLLKVLMWQALTAVAIALLAWLVSFSMAVVISTLYGAMCVVIPSALVARTMIRRIKADELKHSGGMLMGLFALELVKILATVGLLLAARLVLESPQWVAIVVGFVVTLKVYWVVALTGLRQAGRFKKIGVNE